jgi:diaminopimelate epimerase
VCDRGRRRPAEARQPQVEITLPGGKLAIEWRERDDHVLMTGTADFEYEGRFDPALFASVA